MTDPFAAAVAKLATRLPRPLAPLAGLAYNLGWAWQPNGDEIFRAVAPEMWETCAHNPVRLLLEAPDSVLEAAASTPSLLANVERVESALSAELAAPLARVGQATAERPIAFVCAEFGVHASLPIYAGGLGVLAGDLLKEASDQRLPLVGVGLLYRRGYFHQRLDRSGWQHEHWVMEPPERMPLVWATGADGAPLAIRVPVRGRDVAARVWRAQIGRTPLFLLDTDVPENDPIDRWITAELYVRNRDVRLMQYTVLGLGSVRALRALGLDPALYHLNEGHAAFAALELAREEVARGASFADAVARCRSRLVFTTHTPVASGNEAFSEEQVAGVLRALPEKLGVTAGEMLARGNGATDDPSSFSMTAFALRSAASANGVSRRHGEVARAMWRRIYGGGGTQAPIAHITNGVHLPTWMEPAMRALLTRHLGEGWERSAAAPERWAAVDAIPDEELWAVRQELRARLVERIRTRSVADRLARGEPLDYVERAARAFDANMLTMGFARRIASYKRLHLLVWNPSRALALLRGSLAMQVIIAGKAHPQDDDAKRLVQTIFALKDEPMAAARVAFLEDYDLREAREVIAGCDLWVNLPRPPLEASGTSGMKAALNGGINLSVLDGWWSEGFDGTNGWGVRSEPGPDDAVQDGRDADAVYQLLETEIVPLFYERDARGVPRRWVQKIKASMRTIGSRFTARRMLGEYVARCYAR